MAQGGLCVCVCVRTQLLYVYVLYFSCVHVHVVHSLSQQVEVLSTRIVNRCMLSMTFDKTMGLYLLLFTYPMLAVSLDT